MVITGPYVDAVTGEKTLTVSKAAVKKNAELLGISSIDMFISDL